MIGLPKKTEETEAEPTGDFFLKPVPMASAGIAYYLQACTLIADVGKLQP